MDGPGWGDYLFVIVGRRNAAACLVWNARLAKLEPTESDDGSVRCLFDDGFARLSCIQLFLGECRQALKL